MKTNISEISQFILEEVKKIDEELLEHLQEEKIKEGVWDALKGAGGELGRKVKSAAGDIAQAGKSASIRGDLNKLAQRAQNLGMEAEAQSAKNEIQALTDYMRNASRSSLGSMGSNVPTQKKPNIPPTQNKKGPMTMQGQQHSDEWPSGTETWAGPDAQEVSP